MAKKFVNKQTGLVFNIIDLLRDTNQNLMEILHNQEYGLQDILSEENEYTTQGKDITFEDVDSTYAAPSVKRAVWQTMLVIDEIIEAVGRSPDKIFVEVTRYNLEDKKKKRTHSRRERLKELWENIKDLKDDIEKELENTTDNQLRSEKYYLYFLQNGKCAYSGLDINIHELTNDSLYDVDHIIPRALLKDDSIDNKVLVKRVINKKKSKTYPLNLCDEIWNQKQHLIHMWKSWHCAGLITSEKLSRLVRTTPLTDNELEGFINRQLVFAGQSAIVVAELLKAKYGQSRPTPCEICYSKAKNVSDFRNAEWVKTNDPNEKEKYKLYKSREVNDFHHAHDAYLNIVVGNVWNTRFNHVNIRKYYAGQQDIKNNDEKIKNTKTTKISQNNLFNYDIKDAWVKEKSFDVVKKMLSIKDILVTKKAESNSGALYNQNVRGVTVRQKQLQTKGQYSIETTESLIPRKTNPNNPLSDTNKYGGYKSMTPAYWSIVQYDLITQKEKGGKKNKHFEYLKSTGRVFISIPLLYKKTPGK